ncbi:ATP-binding protein [Desulfopila sp. IMCC35008]|uniref:ATP-binding protein n=1 Tax=Desulfopila sp. IMCC35008 TaxID=2653858 RepID=UPI0013D744EF|nr:ATP-binding protein [Desulfopila sp. IMCC35008]
MEYDRLQNSGALGNAVFPISSQEILNDILRISLEPYLFKELLERILSYLVSRKQLHFAGRAAIFLVDPDNEKLVLKASIGFEKEQVAACNNSDLSSCHCGKAVHSGAIHYFSQPPPLNNICPSEDSSKNHYCLPILREGVTVGILALYTNPEHELSVDMEQLLESIGNVLATVIESQKMDQQLIELVNDLRVSIINLREEKLFTESIIQSLSHGLLVVDLQGNIQKSNNVAKHILNPFTRNLDGMNLHTLLGSDTAEKVTTITDPLETRIEKDFTLRTVNGDEKVFSYATSSREDTRGHQVGMIIAINDATELRYVRKEMEKMNRLSTVAEIASAVAHEVRNPLAGIKIMAQSIEEDAVDTEQLECSQRIIRQVDRLNELLTEFFSYARPVVPQKRPTSLSDILSETRPLLGNKLVKNNVSLTEIIAQDLPDIVADPNQMQQVFLNLMLNSIDAIRQNGSIEIHANLLEGNSLNNYKKNFPGHLAKDRYIMVEFSDNGTGMNPEVVEKVFEPFFTTKSTGTGLGLSIVYRTLHENDASITVRSMPGNGTTFSMFFEVHS